MCNKGDRVGRYGWGKNKKKTDLKITKFYAKDITISSRRKRRVEKQGESGNNYRKICVFETNPYLCKCNKKNSSI